MLRVETETGWWLITHQDHARLAAAFAEQWGNASFAAPQPRADVLYGIAVHDDGWTTRDAKPLITREGKPSAFSEELVGKYSAFEEIDLAEYLAVRGSALEKVAATNSYAALLVAMHTYNLLTARADRSTIAPEGLTLLDSFLERQIERQRALRYTIAQDSRFSPADITEDAILSNFRLLQATDNLSLLGCVNYSRPSTLLHPLQLVNKGLQEVTVTPIEQREFRLSPYPFSASPLRFYVAARHIAGRLWRSSEELAASFAAAKVEQLAINIKG